MNPIERAAQYLVHQRRARGRAERIPEEFRPSDIAAALAVQSRVTELLGETVGGWKCGAPVPEKILRAPIYASLIHRSERCPIVPKDGVALIEPELAFVLSRDLAPGCSEGDVLGAIAETHLVIELIGSRYTKPEEATFPEMLADCLNDQGLLVGPIVDRGFGDWMRGFPIQIPGAFEGPGRHPDGHPLIPLNWLAQQVPLRAGQIVTTGSFAGVIQAPLDQPLRVIFGDAGEIAVTFYPDSDR